MKTKQQRNLPSRILGPAACLLAAAVLSGCTTTDRDGNRRLAFGVQFRLGESAETRGFDRPRKTEALWVLIEKPETETVVTADASPAP